MELNSCECVCVSESGLRNLSCWCEEEEKQFEKLDRRVIDYKLHFAHLPLLC